LFLVFCGFSYVVFCMRLVFCLNPLVHLDPRREWRSKGGEGSDMLLILRDLILKGLDLLVFTLDPFRDCMISKYTNDTEGR